ncbi:Candidapepsin-3 [Yarrowia sp. C11]|nr:Candidapepsin-3 [Yarrowia sp. E02]KAG5359477.1 Candidapepsin-3 [Yarrowia sp. C11]
MLLSNTIVVSVLAAIAAAAPATSKVLQLPVTRHSNPNKAPSAFLSKLSAPSVSVTNKEYWYSVALSLGTPAQEFNVLLDTGSSDLWVYASNDTQDCQGDYCTFTGTFDASQSSTYKFKNDKFEIHYVSGDSYGNWGYDTLKIGGVTLTDFQFAAAASAGGGQGVLGVSLKGSESVTGADQYDNFPLKLKKEGFVDRAVYSLYLDDLSSSSGKILFGGIDKAKYEDELAVLPLTSSNAFQVAFSGISIDGKSYGNGGNAVLDSGTSYSYIPDDTFQDIAKDLGLSKTNPSTGLYFIDCDSNKPVTFSFDGKDIVVPSSQMVIPLATLLEDDSQTQCVFGIQSAATTSGYVLFGDTFLRAAYVVYDIDEEKIGIAQAKYTSETDVQPVSGSL